MRGDEGRGHEIDKALMLVSRVREIKCTNHKPRATAIPAINGPVVETTCELCGVTEHKTVEEYMSEGNPVKVPAEESNIGGYGLSPGAMIFLGLFILAVIEWAIRR